VAGPPDSPWGAAEVAADYIALAPPAVVSSLRIQERKKALTEAMFGDSNEPLALGS